MIGVRSTHSGQLERWLGARELENISNRMRGWHGGPVPISGVPGRVHATGDGDFVGRILTGREASLEECIRDHWRRSLRARARATHAQQEASFSSYSDLISEATSGKRQDIPFSKAGTVAGATGQPMSLWNVGNFPAAGGVGGASGTGAVCTRSTTGALGQANPAGGDSLHFVSAWVSASVANTLVLYDRLWHMTYNHATATSTAVDAANRPTRYQGATSAPGNFLSGEVTTALSATAHTLTFTYVDDQGNTAEAAAAYAAPVSAAANRIPVVAPGWFVPLNAGDRGLRYITNVAQSTTASVTGVSNFWIGRMLAIMPAPVANLTFPIDGINSAFNLVEILTDACLALLEWPKTATTATTYNGQVTLVSG